MSGPEAPRITTDTPSETRPDAAEPPRLPPHLRLTISRILAAGIVVSGILLATGIVLLVLADGGSPPTGPVPLPLRTLGHNLAGGDANAVLWLGLIVLVVTPLARVGVSALGFSRLGDRAFLAMTTFVLVILVLSAVIGVRL
ncbi:MAG TPA: DUF1634 domain-containing protein [Thermoplasmata archaeon]|nr:DUF1634 domain-containing protein [Thermoplasmata archaeon]